MTLAHPVVVEALGWAAAATFAASYLAKRPRTLVRVQIAGALMWAVYGVLVRSAPVIAANVLVVAAAAWQARALRLRDAGTSRLAARRGALGPPPPAAAARRPDAFGRAG